MIPDLRKGIIATRHLPLSLMDFLSNNGHWGLTEDKSGSEIPELIKIKKSSHAEQFIAEKYLNHKIKNLKKLRMKTLILPQLSI